MGSFGLSEGIAGFTLYNTNVYPLYLPTTSPCFKLPSTKGRVALGNVGTVSKQKIYSFHEIDNIIDSFLFLAGTRYFYINILKVCVDSNTLPTCLFLPTNIHPSVSLAVLPI